MCFTFIGGTMRIKNRPKRRVQPMLDDEDFKLLEELAKV